MGASFYVSADRRQGGLWTFTDQQVKECIRRHWPDAAVSRAFEDFLEIDVEVEPAQRAELSYNLRHGAFLFEDRAPHSAPLSVVYTVLHELAPTVPVVWWIDYDVELRPLDLAGGREAFISSFPV